MTSQTIGPAGGAAGRTLYERAGGMAFFEALATRFYDGVAHDPVLRRLYPEDLEEPRQRLGLFLAQFWGGPRAYDELRGAPMLRARHMPFAIGGQERDAWLRHMTAAVRESGLSPLDQAQMLGYFARAADHMVNQEPG